MSRISRIAVWAVVAGPRLHPHRVDPPLRPRHSLLRTPPPASPRRRPTRPGQEGPQGASDQAGQARQTAIRRRGTTSRARRITIDEVQVKIDAAAERPRRICARSCRAGWRRCTRTGAPTPPTFLNVVFAGDDTSLTAIVERLTMVTPYRRGPTPSLVDTGGRPGVELKSHAGPNSPTQKAAETKKTAKYEAARDKTLASLENSKDDYNALKKKVAHAAPKRHASADDSAAAQRLPAKVAAAAAAAAKKKTTGTTTRRTTTHHRSPDAAGRSPTSCSRWTAPTASATPGARRARADARTRARTS